MLLEHESVFIVFELKLPRIQVSDEQKTLPNFGS